MNNDLWLIKLFVKKENKKSWIEHTNADLFWPWGKIKETSINQKLYKDLKLLVFYSLWLAFITFQDKTSQGQDPVRTWYLYISQTE